ncbi:MAG TPA: hypothetical protein VGM50_13890 [Gemmatimonadaceae bacterium]|jgi:hypothetical protein
MTQRTRNIIANVFIGISILMVVAFVVQHFTSPPRPTWHKELASLALAFVIASEIVRGRVRRTMRKQD